ncbi:tissue inhibitor of metalloproteinase-like [Liolophura sinensis]|uniref:tissue inhibitor of metalloproteinase-like n=1 Tax=Liolophura sinensis TaxID=3198878 RepID=UPI0031599297
MVGQQLFRYFICLTLFFIGLLRQSSGCSCVIAHPQDMFCKSDFAIRFVVNSSETMDQDHFMYHISQTVVYKNTLEFEKVQSKHVLHTAGYDSMCGVKLKSGEKYFATGFVSGRKLAISSCGWVQKWKGIPIRQRRLIRGGYKKYCGKCKVKQCYGCSKTAKRVKDACIWDSMSPASLCYYQYALCKCKAVPSGQQRCRWSYGHKKRGNNDFITCYKDIQRN